MVGERGRCGASRFRHGRGRVRLEQSHTHCGIPTPSSGFRGERERERKRGILVGDCRVDLLRSRKTWRRRGAANGHIEISYRVPGLSGFLLAVHRPRAALQSRSVTVSFLSLSAGSALTDARATTLELHFTGRTLCRELRAVTQDGLRRFAEGSAGKHPLRLKGPIRIIEVINGRDRR